VLNGGRGATLGGPPGLLIVGDEPEAWRGRCGGIPVVTFGDGTTESSEGAAGVASSVVGAAAAGGWFGTGGGAGRFPGRGLANFIPAGGAGDAATGLGAAAGAGLVGAASAGGGVGALFGGATGRSFGRIGGSWKAGRGGGAPPDPSSPSSPGVCSAGGIPIGGGGTLDGGGGGGFPPGGGGLPPGGGGALRGGGGPGVKEGGGGPAGVDDGGGGPADASAEDPSKLAADFGSGIFAKTVAERSINTCATWQTRPLLLMVSNVSSLVLKIVGPKTIAKFWKLIMLTLSNCATSHKNSLSTFKTAWLIGGRDWTTVVSASALFGDWTALRKSV
jgi:hypothetical protein